MYFVKLSATAFRDSAEPCWTMSVKVIGKALSYNWYLRKTLSRVYQDIVFLMWGFINTLIQWCSVQSWIGKISVLREGNQMGFLHCTERDSLAKKFHTPYSDEQQFCKFLEIHKDHGISLTLCYPIMLSAVPDSAKWSLVLSGTHIYNSMQYTLTRLRNLQVSIVVDRLKATDSNESKQSTVRDSVDQLEQRWVIIILAYNFYFWVLI